MEARLTGHDLAMMPLLGLLIAVATLAAVPGHAAAIAAPQVAPAGDRAAQARTVPLGEVAERGLPPLDVRRRAERQAEEPLGDPGQRARLRAALGPQGVFDVDPLTGTPRAVARLDGYLTGPNTEAPRRIALDYVRDHAAALGISPRALDDLRLTRDYTDIGGTTHLAWEQRLAGIPVFEHGLIANVAADGRLINVMGAPVADPAGAIRELAAALGPRRALGRALGDVGDDRRPPRVRARSDGPMRRARFAGGESVRLMLVPEAPGRLTLAWRVLADVSSTEVYDYLIDAGSGEVLMRENTVDFAGGDAWPYAPGIGSLCPGCGAGAGTQQPMGFPSSWGTRGDRLEGDNAHVYSDVDDDNEPDSPYAECPECGEVPPSDASGWRYPFQANPHQLSPMTSGCDPLFPQCSWGVVTNLAEVLGDGDIEHPQHPEAAIGYGWRDNLRQNATQVYWFVNNFHDWLQAPPFGFTAAAGGFEGPDAVQAEILDGADTAQGEDVIPGTPDGLHLNNANMSTPQEGPPRMQMYLFIDPEDWFAGPRPLTNGGDDATVVYHEYTHGLSGRLVRDANGDQGLRGFQAGAMGEGWSDWYALDYLEGEGIEKPDGAAEGELAMGDYVMGGVPFSLRSEGIDCTVGAQVPACPGGETGHAGGYTLADLGAVGGEPEVHADGEIWAQTLWDLRRRLQDDLGAAQGLEVARSLITRAMELSPPGPSFLDMRNAILQADVVDGGADNEERIWDVFAARGMGYFASDRGSGDTNPSPSFEMPPDCAAGDPCGTLRGRVLERASKRPVKGAWVEVRGPFGLLARTDARGRYRISHVPVPPGGSYRLMAAWRPGHRPQVRRNVELTSGVNRLGFRIFRDWAAIGAGAKLKRASKPDYGEYGCGPEAAFDLSQVTGWGSTSVDPADPETGPAGPKAAVVKLPRAVRVSRLAIDPGATCGDDDSASVKRLRVELQGRKGRRAARRWIRVGTFRFGRADNHRLNGIRLRRPVLGTRRIRVTMLAAQQGLADGTSGDDFMDLSEVQVYGRRQASRGR